MNDDDDTCVEEYPDAMENRTETSFVEVVGVEPAKGKVDQNQNRCHETLNAAETVL